MTRDEFMALLEPLDEAMSKEHGYHEGSRPRNCVLCAIVAMIEVICGLAALEADWDDE